MKPKVYIETSVVSYLTARPSHDLTTASRQATTRDLWENLHKYEAYGSDLVVGEAEKGHLEAAASRLKEIEKLLLLEITSGGSCFGSDRWFRNPGLGTRRCAALGHRRVERHRHCCNVEF